MTPRLLRFRDAPRYLGMDKNRFNREVRPWITVIPIGRQGIAFDRLELDNWVDEYKLRCGRRATDKEGSDLQDARQPRTYTRAVPSNTSSKLAFARAVQRVISKKP